jgi:hypothetical protein
MPSCAQPPAASVPEAPPRLDRQATGLASPTAETSLPTPPRRSLFRPPRA